MNRVYILITIRILTSKIILITFIVRMMLTVITVMMLTVMVMMLTLLSKGRGPTNSQTLVADCYCTSREKSRNKLK